MSDRPYDHCAEGADKYRHVPEPPADFFLSVIIVHDPDHAKSPVTTDFLKSSVVKFPMIEEIGTVKSIEGLYARVAVPKKSS